MSNSIKLYELLRSEIKLSEEKAGEFTLALNEVIKAEVMAQQSNFKSLWKEDFLLLDNKMEKLDSKIDKEISRLEVKIEQIKHELTRSIYSIGLIQFLAIVGSIIGIMCFMLRK